MEHRLHFMLCAAASNKQAGKEAMTVPPFQDVLALMGGGVSRLQISCDAECGSKM